LFPLFNHIQAKSNRNISFMLVKPTPTERHKAILHLLKQQGSVRVAELGGELGVSEITIRRDLEYLEQEHLLERTHGGAVLSRQLRSEPQYTAKYQEKIQEKRQIGAAAAALVEPRETIFIGSGSTTLQIFRPLFGKQVRIITSNAGAVEECQGSDIELILTGGYYREQSHSYTGPLALQAINKFFANKCFIGVDGISLQVGLTTPSLEEAEVHQAMIRQTHGQVVVTADSSKMGVVANCLTAPLDKVDILVVNDSFDEGCREDLEDLNIQIILAV
jgi:DeoR/GlpR family transcriptional regulator of sugar metabolism